MNDTFFRVRTKEECDAGVFPMLDSIKERMKIMRNRIDVPEEQTRLLSHIALFDRRQFVIDSVKYPIQNVLESDAPIVVVDEILQNTQELFERQISDITKDNTAVKNTHFLLGLKRDYFNYWKNQRINKARWFFLIFEVEHDPYYRFRFYWAIEEFVALVDAGIWIIGQDNSDSLTLIRNRFFEYEDNPGRHRLFGAVWSHVSKEYKKNTAEMEWLAAKFYDAFKQGRWQPRPEGQPSFCWKEENNKKEKHWYII